MTAMAGMVPGRAIPIRYNPDNRTQAVWDNHPDESLAQERAAAISAGSTRAIFPMIRGWSC